MKKKSLMRSIVVFFAFSLCAACFPTGFAAPAKAASAKLSVTQTTVEIGKKKTLKVSGAKASSWKSSDSKIATVSKKGVVKGKKEGVCTITAETSSGKLSCKIQVVPTTKKAAEKILAMKDKYPEGTSWTSKNKYTFKHLDGKSMSVTECQAFAFMMSDEAYGDLPAYVSYDWGQLRVGDVVFILAGSSLSDGSRTTGAHVMCVISVDYDNDELIVCDGNRDGKVHWGSKLTISEMATYAGQCIVTRCLPEEGRKDSKRPGAQKVTENKKDKASDGDTYNFVYCKKFDENCTGYQFLLSDKESLPWKETAVYYRGKDFNYIYGLFNETYYCKVRAFYLVDGKILYGAWSPVTKVKI